MVVAHRRGRAQEPDGAGTSIYDTRVAPERQSKVSVVARPTFGSPESPGSPILRDRPAPPELGITVNRFRALLRPCAPQKGRIVVQTDAGAKVESYTGAKAARRSRWAASSRKGRQVATSMRASVVVALTATSPSRTIS